MGSADNQPLIQREGEVASRGSEDGEATTERRDGGMKAGLNTDLEMKEAQDGWRRS